MNPDGSWKLIMQSLIGKLPINLEVKTDGGTIGGSATTDDGQGGPLFEGRVNGSSLFWKTQVTKPMKMTLEFTMTVDGDTMVGKAKAGSFGSYPVKGTRVVTEAPVEAEVAEPAAETVA
jgi:hypothetical protein